MICNYLISNEDLHPSLFDGVRVEADGRLRWKEAQ